MKCLPTPGRIVSLTLLLSLMGCFASKQEASLSQNQTDPTAQSAGEASLDLSGSSNDQLVSYLKQPGGATSPQKETIDQINYAKLKQSLPPRPGASYNSVAFDQFLGTDYSQLDKKLVAQQESSKQNSFPQWAESTSAPDPVSTQPTPENTVDQSIVATAPATKPVVELDDPFLAHVAQLEQTQQQRSTGATSMLPDSKMAAGSAPMAAEQMGVASIPSSASRQAEKMQVAKANPFEVMPTSYTGWTNQDRPTDQHSISKKQNDSDPWVPQTTLSTNTTSTSDPFQTKLQPQTELPTNIQLTRIRIEIQEAKLLASQGNEHKSAWHLQSARDLARQLPADLAKTTQEEINLAVKDAQERCRRYNACLIADHRPKTSYASVPGQPIKTVALNTQPVITPASLVQISPRTSVIDLSRESINSKAINQPNDEIAEFQAAIARANQPISLMNHVQSAPAVASSPRMPANKSLPSNAEKNSLVSKYASAGSAPQTTESETTRTPLSVLNEKLAMLETPSSSPLTYGSLSVPAITFHGATETNAKPRGPAQKSQTTSETSVPQASPAPPIFTDSAVASKDSRLHIPNWLSYGLILSVLAFLLLAFRKM